MPKLKKTPAEQGDILFRQMVGMLLGVTGMTKTELACRCNISEQTFRNRLKNPATVTKGEERIISRLCVAHGIQYRSEFGRE